MSSPNSYVENSNANFVNSLNDLFSQSNMVFVLAFLAIYFVIFFVLKLFLNRGNFTDLKKISRFRDSKSLPPIILPVVEEKVVTKEQNREQYVESFKPP